MPCTITLKRRLSFLHNAEMEHYMSAKSILRTRYRNGFRVNQELGMPLSFVLRIKSHADGVALRCFRQFPRTKLVVVGASFRQLIVAILLLQF